MRSLSPWIMTSGPIHLPSRSPGQLLSLLVAAAALAACGSASQAPVGPAPAPDTAVARTRADSLRPPWTEADVQFMSHMIQHHSQALLMAGWAPTHGASPDIRRLAERIVNSQQDEIATMRRWLSDRGQQEHPVEHHAMRMPGMLTEEQLRALDEARGEAFDRLFLTSMIAHHRGAVTMVKDLFATPGAAQDPTVFKFANDVSADQSSEITRMESLLATHIIETSTP
jgi:uncharacterized protein (DUF305 family)